MKAKEFIGKEVLDAAANRVGKVADIEVDIMEGGVHNISVKAGSEPHHLCAYRKDTQ